VFTGMFDGANTRTVVDWFDIGGTLLLSDASSADEVVSRTEGIQGLHELAGLTGLPPGAPAPALASAIDFVLEGLCAQKKISRSDDRGYGAGTEPAPRRSPRRDEPTLDEEVRLPGVGKKKYYN
jgi:magnesium chelatase subunit I